MILDIYKKSINSDFFLSNKWKIQHFVCLLFTFKNKMFLSYRWIDVEEYDRNVSNAVFCIFNNFNVKRREKYFYLNCRNTLKSKYSVWV